MAAAIYIFSYLILLIKLLIPPDINIFGAVMPSIWKLSIDGLLPSLYYMLTF